MSYQPPPVYVQISVKDGRSCYYVRDRRCPGDAILSTHSRLSDARRERKRLMRETTASNV